MKKILDEIKFLTEHYETKSEKGLFIDALHLLLYGAGFFIMLLAVIYFLTFIIIIFKFKTVSYSVLLSSLGLIILSWYIKKIRVYFFFRKKN